ncbi:MAG: bifunctional diaminohydroxyphosphoribosylaminopyrimidine deaminase/5-amino-6-(5-phosphoribosylamino)uracil reductase RibD [Bacteroidota bacterium]
MRRAIQLGKNAMGSAAPNPMVGAVIVSKDQIIGEGYTSAYGGSHAEVNAVNAVKNQDLLAEATLYVTLEPCSHYGKTPPCCDMIIAHRIPKIVIGLQDPNPKVSGQGIQRLRNNGCEVSVGVLEAECREHHKRFLMFQEHKRPYIKLKWAESKDGYIAPKEDKRDSATEPFWITNPYSRQLVHQYRSETMAILVGTTTVLRDNPSLTTRDWYGTHPIRVVLDRSLRIGLDHKIYDSATPTIVFTAEKDLPNTKDSAITYEKIDFSKALPEQICACLYQNNIHSLLVEGGQQTLQTFIDADLWDEALVFRGDSNLGDGLRAPKLKGDYALQGQLLKDTLTTILHD